MARLTAYCIGAFNLLDDETRPRLDNLPTQQKADYGSTYIYVSAWQYTNPMILPP